MPPVKPDTSGTDELPFSTDKWDELRQSLREKIGPIDAYWEIFDSTEKQEPVQVSIAGDISEIYIELEVPTWRTVVGERPVRSHF